MSKDEQFEFLYTLRDEGSTNMLGAGENLAIEFGLTRKKANSILKEWIKSFENEPTTLVSLDKMSNKEKS